MKLLETSTYFCSFAADFSIEFTSGNIAVCRNELLDYTNEFEHTPYGEHSEEYVGLSISGEGPYSIVPWDFDLDGTSELCIKQYVSGICLADNIGTGESIFKYAVEAELWEMIAFRFIPASPWKTRS